MHLNRHIPFLFAFILTLTSCSITDKIGIVQIEIMKPGIVNIPNHADTIAIFNRDFYKSDTCKFEYFNGLNANKDTTVKYRNLLNSCADGLAKNLENEGYFKKVYNFRDSLNGLWPNEQFSAEQKEELFKKTRSNVWVLLDYFHFYQNWIGTHWDYNTIAAQLSWTIAFRNDTLSYFYNQSDTLIYDNAQANTLIKDGNIKPLLKNAAETFGQSFGSKLIPSWISVDRMYYKSANPNMLKAESFARENNWLKAAEIWNRMTVSKNKKMAAKACYNMALACEMEGKPDLSIDWLIHSYKLTRKNVEHQFNCKRYINILALRKKDFERLNLQVRIHGEAQNQEQAE